MGNRVMRAVALDTTPMSDRARCVLFRMAVSVLDTESNGQAAAEYWRGWQWLAMPWADTLDDAAQRRAVQRALAELNALGMVKTTGNAHRGQRQRYVITIPY